MKEYNSVSRQNRASQYLQNLKHEKIVEKKQCDASEGLEKIRGLITKFTLEGPCFCRFKEATVEYLLKLFLICLGIKRSLHNVSRTIRPGILSTCTLQLTQTGYKIKSKKCEQQGLQTIV